MDTPSIISIILSIILFFSLSISLFKYKKLSDVVMTCLAVAIVCSYFELNISSFYSDLFNGQNIIDSYQKNLINSTDHSPATESLFWLYTTSIVMLFICLLYYAFKPNDKNISTSIIKETNQETLKKH